jgi:hypothetical protein
MINKIDIYPLIIHKIMKDNIEFAYDFQLSEQMEEREIGKATFVREQYVTEQNLAL